MLDGAEMAAGGQIVTAAADPDAEQDTMRPVSASSAFVEAAVKERNAVFAGEIHRQIGQSLTPAV